MFTLTVGLPETVDEWADFDGSELDDKTRELEVAGRRLEAAIVGATGRAARTAHFQRDGHRSVTSWLMATTNCSYRSANARRQSAETLRALTHVSTEFIAGRVGVDQVRELARVGANPRCGDQVGRSEDILLQAAQSLEFADFRTVTRRWSELADADGAHREHDSVHEHRNARCTADGAEFRFETSHGIIVGASMREVFEAFCTAEFDRDWQWVRDTYGAEAKASLLPRSASQRRADAFVAMVLAAAEAGTGNGRSIDVTANLVCDIDQFEQYVEHEISTSRSTSTRRRFATGGARPPTACRSTRVSWSLPHSSAESVSSSSTAPVSSFMPVASAGCSTVRSETRSRRSTRCADGSAAICGRRSPRSTIWNRDPEADRPTRRTRR